MNGPEEQYSRVSRRMWRDEKFRRLSRPAPSARELWFYLLTNPRSTAIPGLLAVGPMGLAEDLDWPADVTAALLDEIQASGLVHYDQEAKLIWLPRAVRHNLPANPNTVLSWGQHWRLLPECALRDLAADGIRAILAAADSIPDRDGGPRGGGKLAIAFDVAIGKTRIEQTKIKAGRPAGKRRENGIPNGTQNRSRNGTKKGSFNGFEYQDQDQDQDQELVGSPLSPPAGGAPKPKVARRGAGEAGAPAGRKGRPIPPSILRYADAYAAGQTDASGQPFAPPVTGKAPRVFVEVLPIHALDRDGKPLEQDALDAWIRQSSAAYRRAVPNPAREDGYSPTRWQAWLQGGGLRGTAAGRVGLTAAAVLDVWARTYPESQRNYGPYLPHPLDMGRAGELAESIAAVAETRAAEVGTGGNVLEIALRLTSHYAKRYLRLDGTNGDARFVNHRHPFRFIADGISLYGTPWAPAPDVAQHSARRGHTNQRVQRDTTGDYSEENIRQENLAGLQDLASKEPKGFI